MGCKMSHSLVEHTGAGEPVSEEVQFIAACRSRLDRGSPQTLFEVTEFLLAVGGKT
jgi:hypothetical protein